jgi:outer membrane protein OmpA-like peptidoglycan-associated protein
MGRLIFIVCIVLFAKPVLAQEQTDLYIKGNGLYGEYYNGYEDRKLLAYTRIDPQINFYWNQQPPAPGVGNTDFFVRWTGKLFAPKTARTRIIFTADDGVRLWLDGKLLIDEWKGQEVTSYVTEVNLKRGQSYHIKIEFFQKSHDATARLYWQFGSDPRELITARYLYTSDEIKKVFEASPIREKTIVDSFIDYYNKSMAVFADLFKEEPQPVVYLEKKDSESTLAQTNNPSDLMGDVDDEEQNQVRKTEEKNMSQITASTRQIKGISGGYEIVEDLSIFDRAFKAKEYGKIIKMDRLYFEKGKFYLKKESYPQLDELANSLLKYKEIKITVMGHTDNVGDPVINERLSLNRATVVANYLIERGVDKERIEVIGYGGRKPVHSNQDEENRSKNRRVEIMIK